MNEITEKRYRLSYKELKEKLGIEGKIVAIAPSVEIGKYQDYEEHYGLDIIMESDKDGDKQ